MKKTSLKLLTMVLVGLSTITNAQNNTSCKLNAKFKLKPDKCSVAFADASTAEKGTTIKTWSWDFGDNTTDTVSKTPTHVYAHSGHYTACLTITGVNAKGEKCKDKACLPVEVLGCNDSLLCKLSAKFDSKTDSCSVKFVNSSTAGAGTTITGYFWTFGDGDSAKVKDPTHVYKHSGHYTACLTIAGVNSLGLKCFDKECHSVMVKDCGGTIDSTHCKLAAVFKSKTDSCTVKFTDASSAGLGTTITSYHWTFGDGDSSNVQNPSHDYKFSGHYMACLTIEGVNKVSGIKCKDKECHFVDIKGCGADTTHCRLSSKFSSKVDSCTATFTDASTAGAGTTITSWHWTFGDGDSSNVKNPTHVYAHSGHYSACLVIEGVNALGVKCKDKECHSVMVKGCGIFIDSVHCKLAAFLRFKTDSCTVKFEDASSSGLGTTITSYHWSFGDGDTSIVKNPTHEYDFSGRYMVCLTIEGVNSGGIKCKDKQCRFVDVKGCGKDTTRCRLSSKFEYKNDSTNFTFDNNSIAGKGTTITSYKWTFGDGDSSLVENPTHTYAKKGKYLVCLTIEGVNTASGTKCKDRECRTIDTRHPHREGIVEEEEKSILQFYPNPAQDQVNINYTIPAAGQVNIEVTDIQGRILAVIQNGYQAAGSHNVIWNVAVHPGWYLISIRTDAGTEQKRLLIQK